MNRATQQPHPIRAKMALVCCVALMVEFLGCPRTPPTAPVVDGQQQQSDAADGEIGGIPAQPEPPLPQLPPLIPGPQTTFVVNGESPGAAPDFVKFVNALASAGVTAETNAVVPLLGVITLEFPTAETQSQYASLLGLQSLPRPDNIVISRQEFFQKRGLSEEQIAELFQAQLSPRLESESPEIAAWVRACDASLNTLHTMSQREGFYIPVILSAPDEMLIRLSRRELAATADLVRAASWRAMFRLGEGNCAGACEDSLAILKLGNSSAKSPIFFTHLAGVAISGVGQRTAREILLSRKLTLGQAKAFQDELAKIQPPASVAGCLGEAERVYVIQALVDGKDLDFVDISGPVRKLHDRTDKNLALPILNASFDDLRTVASQSPRRERMEKLKAWEEALSSVRERVQNKATLTRLLASGTASEIATYMGETWVTLMVPDARSALNNLDRLQARQDLLRVGAAIEVFRLTFGGYPDSVDQLTPEFLSQLPLDPFTDQGFAYKRHGEDYLLYSFGENGIDNGGVERHEFRTLLIDGDDQRIGSLPDPIDRGR